MQPTWESVADLLRGARVRPERTWQILEQHYAFIAGHVRHVVRGARDVSTRLGGLDSASQAAFQWVMERLHRRVHNPPPGLPVSERRNGESSAARWFATVVRNLTRDWLKSERRRTKRETALDESRPPATAPEPPLFDDGALRKLERLLARPERAGVPDTHVLAYLALYRPDVLDLAMVTRAHAYVPSSGTRSGHPGLRRDVRTTWEALAAWRERHHHDPRSTAARSELAWILRSEDPGPPETWRQRDLPEAKRCAVTVGKWAIRCADVLTLPRR